ncbi:DNA cytosine methyltransferase [Planctellipticum variicoloris]|uniref:DNA cytosine methyltransferase n=1 Tax=Planctellipticum variicoloris TaxID=3064265 RepID=UPI0030136991|nr:DNA (cytosine-5-)-methyltransferase [Planctomycetaceae bacterium SH412]
MARVNRMTSPYRVAEFFAGIGLVRLALDQCGFETVFANDIDEQKLEMYRANFPIDEFLLGDIHQISADAIPDCDLFTASFPCNDLSIAGAMAGLSGEQSSAFWGLVRLLKEKAVAGSLPKVVLLENVPGFLMANEGRDFEAALLALNALGYVCDAIIVDAVRFVPQSRARLFVIAQLGIEAEIPFGVGPSDVRSPQLLKFIHGTPHIAWKIRKLPPLPPAGPRLPSIVESLPPDDPAWWSEERAAYFMNQLSERHAKIAAEMISGADYTYATAFRRVRHGRSMAELRTDGIAGCLRTPRGGSGRQILFEAGRGERRVRLLTARECARLQGVPDDYRIEVRLNQALFGFGDAVCVPVVAWIGENYLKPACETLRGSIRTVRTRRITVAKR